MNRISHLWRASGLTQPGFGKKIGVSQARVSQLVNGAPENIRVQLLADAFAREIGRDDLTAAVFATRPVLAAQSHEAAE